MRQRDNLSSSLYTLYCMYVTESNNIHQACFTKNRKFSIFISSVRRKDFSTCGLKTFLFLTAATFTWNPQIYLMINNPIPSMQREKHLCRIIFRRCLHFDILTNKKQTRYLLPSKGRNQHILNFRQMERLFFSLRQYQPIFLNSYRLNKTQMQAEIQLRCSETQTGSEKE